MNTVDVSYAGQTVALADLPEYAKFYRKLASGAWEPRTFEVLSRHLDRDTVCIDVGAWIGVTPLWAAKSAKAVVAVEPDPKCLAILRSLSERVPNLTILEGAVSDASTVAIHAVEGFGSSETSALDIGDGGSATVPGIGIDSIMQHAGGSPAFVKIDIEGYEFALRDELAKLKAYPLCALQIALHPALYERSLAGPLAWRRARTLWEVWRLLRSLTAFLSRPAFARYNGVFDYLVRGVLLRRKPRGADAVFERALWTRRTA